MIGLIVYNYRFQVSLAELSILLRVRFQKYRRNWFNEHSVVFTEAAAGKASFFFSVPKPFFNKDASSFLWILWKYYPQTNFTKNNTHFFCCFLKLQNDDIINNNNNDKNIEKKGVTINSLYTATTDLDSKFLSTFHKKATKFEFEKFFLSRGTTMTWLFISKLYLFMYILNLLVSISGKYKYIYDYDGRLSR